MEEQNRDMQFEQLLADAQIECGIGQVRRMAAFNEILQQVNEQMNLTAITGLSETVQKHYVDSLLGLKTDIEEGAQVLDVGCGAGFPSVPLMLARPDLHFTLLDALQKRLDFIEKAMLQINCPPPVFLHGRAEQFGKDGKYRERFDVVIARAVASLSVLAEYCLPFVKVGGSFLAYKGPGGEQELADARNAIALLGGEPEQSFCFTLAGGEQRTILKIRKCKPTPGRFPRNTKKIKECAL